MNLRLISALLLAIGTAGCASSRIQPQPSSSAAMTRVLQQDEALSAVRNHACETGLLSEAIGGYVEGLAALDYEGCPAGFVDAFARHREAWESSIPFFMAYDDLRGEMHDLFEQIRASSEEARAGLEAIEAAIWGTWSEVEAAVESP